jgi:hypothetical protein
MNHLRPIVRILALVAATAVSVFAASAPASADLPAFHGNRAHTPQNEAGVVFRPHGDDFEIWDNVRDNKPVTVYYRYFVQGAPWHTIVSHVHVGTYRRNMKEYPNNVEFYVVGHNKFGARVTSALYYYRTWGS